MTDGDKKLEPATKGRTCGRGKKAPKGFGEKLEVIKEGWERDLFRDWGGAEVVETGMRGMMGVKAGVTEGWEDKQAKVLEVGVNAEVTGDRIGVFKERGGWATKAVSLPRGSLAVETAEEVGISELSLPLLVVAAEPLLFLLLGTEDFGGGPTGGGSCKQFLTIWPSSLQTLACDTFRLTRFRVKSSVSFGSPTSPETKLIPSLRRSTIKVAYDEIFMELSPSLKHCIRNVSSRVLGTEADAGLLEEVALIRGDCPAEGAAAAATSVDEVGPPGVIGGEGLEGIGAEGNIGLEVDFGLSIVKVSATLSCTVTVIPDLEEFETASGQTEIGVSTGCISTLVVVGS
ncbi:unnamed protein product [Arabidopsis thaliana]|uniref:Uncharacterized protein n=1 Tax=Arabidopsis thaliana TaxID=3702 RepID=A0A654FBP4_ARATH|nr:unnamed protein product [Arabidopsis thaliana]